MLNLLEPPVPPFPKGTFRALAAGWIALDVVVMLLLWRWGYPWGALLETLIVVWQAVLAAKVMLMLGWWFLGEGQLSERLTGAILFFPLLVPPLVLAFFEPEFLCMLATVLIFSIPGLFIVGWPYLVLQLMDYRLARDAPRSSEKFGQFTVRQLMLITLVAAIVLGVLRWAEQAKLGYAVVGLLVPLLGWIYPPVACLGLLHERWYPRIVYAVGLSAWLLALPLFALPEADAQGVLLFVSVYLLTFTAHLLLLRGLGFRLVNHRPRVQYDPGIRFIEPDEPGIVWIGEGRSALVADQSAAADEVFGSEATNRRSSS